MFNWEFNYTCGWLFEISDHAFSDLIVPTLTFRPGTLIRSEMRFFSHDMWKCTYFRGEQNKTKLYSWIKKKLVIYYCNNRYIDRHKSSKKYQTRTLYVRWDKYINFHETWKIICEASEVWINAFDLRFYLLPVSLWSPAPSWDAYRCHKVICREILNRIILFYSYATIADECTITGINRTTASHSESYSTSQSMRNTAIFSHSRIL